MITFKNPNRKVDQSMIKSSKYLPEWQRLGKEAIVYETNPSDLILLNGKKKESVKTLKPSVLSNGLINPLKVKPQPDSLPQQTKVSVGLHNNWLDSTEEKQSPISYDDVPDPPKPDSEMLDEVIEEPESIEILKSGEYGIFVKNVFVVKTTLLSESEEIIEKILFDEIPAFSKVSMGDIMLIHRLPLKIGVLAVT